MKNIDNTGNNLECINEEEIKLEGIEEEYNNVIYPIDSDKITSSITTYDVFNLAANVERGKIEIQPVYQRTYVWNDEKAEKFIDSLWNNLPIPPLFFLQKENGKFIVIDGQQRLTSLLRFYYNELAIEKNLPSLQNTIVASSKKLKVSQRIFNKSYRDINIFFEDLDEEIKNNFENREVNLVIIKPNYSIIKEDEVDKIIKEIFYRLNTGGVKLSEQEIRQSLYTGKFMNNLKIYSFNTNWQNLFPNIKKITDNPSLLTEFLLRGFAFLDTYATKSQNDTIGLDIKYSKPLGSFLDEYAKQTEKFDNKQINDRFELVKNVVSSLLSLEDPSSIFSHKKGVKNPKTGKELNKSLNVKYIDMLFVGLLNLFRQYSDISINVLKNIISEFKEDKDIIEHIVRGGSSDEKYVQERVTKSIRLVDKLYKQFK